MSLIFKNIKSVFLQCKKINYVQVKHLEGFVDWRMLKDFRKRQTVKQYGPERLRINALRKNTILPKALREIADSEIAAYPRNAALNRVVARCCLTSRPRGVVKGYRISRIMFRHFADYNEMAGIQRAMW